MQGAVRDVTLVQASACVSVPTISVPILESDRAHSPFCTNKCLYRYATRRKLKLKLRVIRSVKFYACRKSRVREQIRVTLKTPLVLIDSVRTAF
jgi:hypothetical protein